MLFMKCFGASIAHANIPSLFGDWASFSQKYWVGGGSTSAHSQLCPSVSESGLSSALCTDNLPVLCANSAPNGISNQTDLSLTWQDRTRDHLSFRSLGIPYAEEPARWTYSSPYTGSPTISALTFGSPCTQVAGYGLEDCLFLNIFTPFLPGPATLSSKLKPVMFFIHFTGGEGSDSDLDGENSAIRRFLRNRDHGSLGALGFLALDNGVTNGNYGLADQITALERVQAHVASFGGDPSRVTIFGQSAGAAVVRALLEQPRRAPYGTTDSEYYTIEQEVEVAAGAFVEEVGCGNGAAADVLACLEAAPWQTLQTAPDAPRYEYCADFSASRGGPRDRLSIGGKGPIASNANVIFWFGWRVMVLMSRAVLSLSNTTQATSIEGIPIAANLTASVLASGLFPRPSTGNETLDTFNVTAHMVTDGEFRCLDQATAYSAALHSSFKSMWTYQFDRSYMSYEPIPIRQLLLHILSGSLSPLLPVRVLYLNFCGIDFNVYLM
ncbi:Alpha/Beta hydrolase protein [Mycena sanguinolenta]|nr:Alpha/Beta hydrolase protein [Mycena sanguinolenta]